MVIQYTWVLFAWCALSLFTAALCMGLHLRTRSQWPRHIYLLVLGAVLAGVGCMMGGIQAGVDPLWPPQDMRPAVRLLWSLAATCVMMECLLYLRDGYKKERDL